METLLSICVGLGLSAACGFRVFVPLLVTSIAAYSGHLTLSPGFAWIGSPPAMIAFGIATILEIAAYYIPVVDNFLDTVATPAAVVAGIILTASMTAGLSPFLKWTLAVIAGGGVAGLIQAGTVTTRAFSTAGTAGLTNPLLATVELGGSFITAVLALVAPVLTILVIIAVVIYLGSKFLARLRKSPPAPTAPPTLP